GARPGSAAWLAKRPVPSLALTTSLVQLRAAALRYPHLLAVLGELHADTGRLVRLRVDEHHVADVDARLLLDETAARVLLRGLAGLLDDVHVLDEDAALVAQDREDLALLALVLAGDDADAVALADAGLDRRHHSTSGARDTMRMKRLSRSSRATGPNTRVPRGSFWLLMITAAFESKRMEEPSLRLTSFLVRTITALTTSPFLTAACGIASFTAATITSPTDPTHCWPVPSTRMHWIVRAPELSATSRYVSCWIIAGGPLGARLLDQARHDPALALADRTAGRDLDDVAHAVLVGLVVGQVPLRDGNDLAVERVLEAPLDVDGHGLVGLV